MATISRKFKDFRQANKVVQTTHNWIIKVEQEGAKKASKLKDSKIEFKVNSVGGCPPEDEAETVNVEVGGFTFKYYGKIKKDGDITFAAFEDAEGKVGDLAREIKRIWGKGVTASGKPDEATLISDDKYIDSSGDVRFKITVQLADNAGNVTKQWIFYDATGKVNGEGELGQEADSFKYNFTFSYTMYEEGKGTGDDTW
jgi:hypothetical protein